MKLSARPGFTATRWFGRTALLVALCATFASRAAADPSCAINTTTNSGAAPLGVVFWAGIDGDVDPQYPDDFLTLRFEWSFADPNSGVWSLSGKSKNEALGGVAAHVFENAGAYPVTLRIISPDGASCTTTHTVTVIAANSAWAGPETKCVCNTANFAGCPSGATQVQSGDFDAQFMNADDRRTLLCRGGTFSNDATRALADATANGSMVGAYGTGARPIINSTGSGDQFEQNTGWRFVGLDFRGTAAVNAAFRRKDPRQNGPTQFLVHDTRITGYVHCFDLPRSNNPTANSGMVVSDIYCRIADQPVRGIFDQAEKTAYMGVDMDLSGLNAATMVRMAYADKLLFQHGRWRSVGDGILSIRACNPNDSPQFCPGTTKPNQFVIVSDNQFYDDSGAQRVNVVCSHSACDLTAPEGKDSRYFIFERNFHAFGGVASHGPFYVTQHVSKSDIRNNVFDLRGSTGDAYTVVSLRTGAPRSDGVVDRDGVRIFGNTIYTNESLGQLTICDGNGGSGHSCQNNLVFAPNVSNVSASSGAGWIATEGNLVLDRTAPEYSVANTAVGPFIGTIPARNPPTSPTIASFRLCATGSCVTGGRSPVDSAVDISGGGLDIFEGCRNGRWDVGAHEIGATSCRGGGSGPAALEPPLLLAPN